MAAGIVGGFLLVLAGCRQEMADQPRYEAYEAAGMFSDSTIMRQPVEGTVSRDSELERRYRPSHQHGSYPLQQADGHEPAGTNDFPIPITADVLERGRNRFNIYCSPCHGQVGDGLGIIVERGLRKPPSFHTERLRNAPSSHFYEVITNGFGAMYSYASRVKPADRWAITAYIRALQLSQNANVADVPVDSNIVEESGPLAADTTVRAIERAND